MSIDQAGRLAKVGDAATLGLLGISDSVAYRVGEAERHFHSYESWFGAAVAPNAEIHVADRIGTTTTPFVMDAGNLTWGNWLQIAGSSDLPARVGNVKFDYHKLAIVAVERASTIHFIQIASGTSGAAGLAAGTYTEFVYWAGAAVSREAPILFQMRRIDAGTKMWARVLAVGKDTGTVGFFVGEHGYEG
jgi:hypothetical protein